MLSRHEVKRKRDIIHKPFWVKKWEKKISKIVQGVKSRGKHFREKWGLTDIRKLHDSLGKKIMVLYSKGGSLNSTRVQSLLARMQENWLQLDLFEAPLAGLP